MLAGAITGVFAATVATPTERIKCLMQVQKGSKSAAKYSSNIDCAVKLYKEGGVRSIYKGALSTLLRGDYVCLCSSYLHLFQLLHALSVQLNT